MPRNKLDRKFFLGFIRLHILHHAKQKQIFGLWIIEELNKHGYKMSPGTMYPILHNLEIEGFLKSSSRNINGKIRKYYEITKTGIKVLDSGIIRARELLKELV